jgi:SAM-dependent methyltransferase
MDIRNWDQRYRLGEQPSADLDFQPAALVVETASKAPAGKALDLACGAGRNALWLAAQGWSVTAVDGAPAAIEILRQRGVEQGLQVDARVANLEKSEYRIEPSAWDLIAICYYLQRDLFEPAKLGLKPGGLLLAIAHITEPGEEPTYKRLKPGELSSYFQGWEIVHLYEGKPNDSSHRRRVAEIVARRPSDSGVCLGW